MLRSKGIPLPSGISDRNEREKKNGKGIKKGEGGGGEDRNESNESIVVFLIGFKCFYRTKRLLLNSGIRN